jgi:hypothetical protein
VHEATGNILSQILQARFDDCVVDSDSRSNPLRLSIYLAADRRLLPAQRVLVSTAHHPILINRKLEKHVSIAFLLLCKNSDSKKPPPWYQPQFPHQLLSKFVIEIVLDVVVYFECSIATKIIYVVPVVVPFRAVKSPGYIFVFPEIQGGVQVVDSVDFRETGGLWPFRPISFEAFKRNVRVCKDKLRRKTCMLLGDKQLIRSGTIMDVERISCSSTERKVIEPEEHAKTL